MNVYDFGLKSVISHVELSAESKEQANKLLEVAGQFHEEQNKFMATLPDNTYIQFFGNWDIILVKKRTDDDELYD